MCKHATPKLVEVLNNLSTLPPWELFPDQYEEYIPSFQEGVRLGTTRSSPSNAATRMVGKGSFSVKNLLDPEKRVQLDNDDDVKKLVEDALAGERERD